jgi:hypothetical protein
MSGQQLSIAPLIDADDHNGSGETFGLIGEEKVGAAQLNVGEQPAQKRGAYETTRQEREKGGDGQLLQAESWHRAILENQSRPINRRTLSPAHLWKAAPGAMTAPSSD